MHSMLMNRRDFSLTALAASGLALAPAVRAQGAPVAGTHYKKLQQVVPVSAPAGKIEVLEFFGYGCPHCNALEPTLEQWIKLQPADVVVKRVPAIFNAVYETHGRIFYALESLGLLDSMHRKVFHAIHVDKKSLGKDSDILAFMTANGVDGAKFTDALKSFTVQTRIRQARQLMEGYQIDSVPTLAVHGRYTTSASQAGSNEGALKVVDYLVQQVRAGR